jgi:glucosamine--fructose-6-phosphate aminotransferase (isomerizing)
MAARAAVEGAGDWIEFWAGADGIYLLGRGSALASAHEGALLLHEAARTPAAALSAAQFRHGPVEVTGAGTRAVIFPAPGPTRELDLALAADLERMGARVRLSDGQGIDHPFEPVVEIIPLQVAACALAQAHGLDPGDFRYASLVTASEAGFRSFR